MEDLTIEGNKLILKASYISEERVVYQDPTPPEEKYILGYSTITLKYTGESLIVEKIEYQKNENYSKEK